MKLDDQNRIRFADHNPVDRSPINRNPPPQIDHRPIHQLHRFRLQRHQMLRRRHRRAKIRKLANPQHLARLDRMQHQFQRRRKRQRPLGAHQQPRQIPPPARPGSRRQRIDVIPPDAPQLLRDARRNLLRLPPPQRQHPLHQPLGPHPFAKPGPRPIRQHRIDRRHIIRHQPITDRLRPARIIPRHSPDRAPGIG